MCGRATLSSPAEDVAEIFDALPIDIGPARFNIAPSQPIVTVRSSASSSSSQMKRELTMMRWGLMPWWAKPDEVKRIASKSIQARVESLKSASGAHSAFRDTFKQHRCLVVFDGFFEWKTLPDGRRIPHHIRKTNREPFAIAGIWDSWAPPDPNAEEIDQDEIDHTSDARVKSCAVLTTAATGAIREVHTRMPLILPANEWSTWLSGSAEDAAKLLSFDKNERLARVSELVAIPVSTRVNNVKNDDPECIAPTPIGDAPSSDAKPKEKAMKKPAAAPTAQIGFAFAAASDHRNK